MDRTRYLLVIVFALLLMIAGGRPATLQARSEERGNRPGLNLGMPQAQREPAATGQVTGTVTAEGGAPLLAGIQVRLYRQEGTSWQALLNTESTAGDGTYTFTGLVAGIYRAEFSDPAGAYSPEYYDDETNFNLATNFAVNEGETTGNIDAALAPAGAIGGTVTEVTSGDSLSDISVTAWFWNGSKWTRGLSGLTNEQGVYTIEGLPPDTYRVRFSDVYFPARYFAEYYDDAATIDVATDVAVGINTVSGIDAVLAPSGLAALAVPLDAFASGDDVLLEWAHKTANEKYTIFWAQAPYFDPAGASELATVAAPTASYSHDGILANAGNYYYLVRALCCSDTSSADSNFAGVFRFALVAGGP